MLKRIRTSITTKLILLFLAVGLSSVLFVGIYSFYSAKRSLIQRTVDQLISVRTVKKQQIEYFLQEKARNLSFLAMRPDLLQIFTELGNSPSPENGKQIPINYDNLITYVRNYGFSHCYLLRPGTAKEPVIKAIPDPSGTLSPGLRLKLATLWGSIRQTDSVIILDLFTRFSRDTLPVLLFGQQVQDPNGKMAGALVLEVSSLDINRIMLQNNSAIGLGQSGEAYIVGGDLLMRSASRFIPHSVLSTPVNTVSARLALSGKTGAIETPDYRNIPVFSAYEPLSLKGLKWIILAEIDYKEAIIPIAHLRNDILLVSIIISLFILAIARLISQMITEPIISLKNAASKFGKGDFSSKVQLTSTDEIGALGQTFNTMIGQIREERKLSISAVYDGQEMERQRISRELHDGMGQKLVAAKLQLENCEGEDLRCLQNTVSEIKSLFGSLIEDTRLISNDLMPSSLHELGLENALQNLCKTVQRQSNIEIEFYSHCPTLQANGKTTVYLYRIAQEGISNVIRHAEATSVSMQLVESKGFLIFILEDNGRGFPADDPEYRKGNGLYNMKERAGLLGGTFNLETEPGKGTTLRVKIPLDA